jgi:TolB-like protein/Tfp pilus assembly protein PilF
VTVSDPVALLPLAESIADGMPVDWHAVEGRASSDEQGIIRQLRILSNLAALHRSLPAGPDESPAAPIGRRSQSAPAIGNWAHLALVERLGSGTFGEVYRAWDRHLEREVALKLLRLSDSAGAIEDPQSSRIAREGRLLARVRHPNVITVHGVEVHDGRVGLCMELIRGTSLEELLLKRGPFSAREASLIGIDLCRALASIHASGLIHRDVKAQNVLREDGGRIVLMDLGTGREIDPDGGYALPDLAGTPLYLAPEIFDGAPASENTDLYSLGVLLYHLVTGSFPVRATNIDELREGQATGAGVWLRDARPDLPTAFVRVVDRAIAADPGRRYASAGALESDLVAAFDVTASFPADEQRIHERSRSSRQIGVLAATVIFALVLGAYGLRQIWSRGVAPAAVAGHVSLLAILPFENLSTDGGEAYLANAVPMELTARLGQIGALKVVPWTFMRRFSGTGQHSLKEVAERTGADAVIEGSVQRAPSGGGSQGLVQIRVQVFQAGTGSLLWSASFERSISDFFVVQAQIAQEVAARVHVVLAARDRALVVRSRRVPPDAMEDYLNARYLMEVQMNLQGAIELFRRATEEAPGFAEAYVGLASCYALESAYFGAVPSQVALGRALDASNRAIELDPGIPEAWAARAFARFTLERNWAGAESDFEHALEIGPDIVDVLASYSNYLTIRGRHVEAIDAGRTAEARAPFSAAASRQVAWAYYMAHQYDNVIRQISHVLEIEPGYVPARTLLGRTYLLKGEWAQAIQELEGVSRDYSQILALGYAMAGRRDDAERLLNEILSPSYGRPVVPYQVALIHVALGNTIQALDWLDAAYRDKDPALVQMAVDPMLDPIRSEPRFQGLLASLNLQP